MCDEGGRLEEGWVRGQGTETAGIFCKPCASQKPFNVARALICALNPTPNPKPRLTAGSKAEAEHKPSTLANLDLYMPVWMSDVRVAVLVAVTLTL